MTSVAEGLTNAETGERLYMSPATARTHVSRILTELNARDRTELVGPWPTNRGWSARAGSNRTGTPPLSAAAWRYAVRSTSISQQ
ncbi:response regulator transcription factor [Nocardia asiatica]|nr:LuxR C-terminal-related transcriptional regulator [Nocardia asiatica]